MPKQVRLRRGTTVQHSTFTGADGELTVDTTKKTLVLHDGVTAGGKPFDGFLKLTPATILTPQTIAGPVIITGGDSETQGLSVANQATFNQVIANTELQAERISHLHAFVAYAATIDVPIGGKQWKTISLTGNLTLTGSGYLFGQELCIRIAADGSLRTLTFPANWKFIGAAAPANIAANKTGLLILRSFGTTDTEVIAKWEVQP